MRNVYQAIDMKKRLVSAYIKQASINKKSENENHIESIPRFKGLSSHNDARLIFGLGKTFPHIVTSHLVSRVQKPNWNLNSTLRFGTMISVDNVPRSTVMGWGLKFTVGEQCSLKGLWGMSGICCAIILVGRMNLWAPMLYLHPTFSFTSSLPRRLSFTV